MAATCKVRDYDRLFRSLASKRKPPRRPCDGLKFGKLDAPVRKVALSWMATIRVVERAAKLGADLIIHHEPLFYCHLDNDAGYRATGPARAKSCLLRKHGISVYRVHDLWDFFPEWGILDSWGKELGLKRLARGPGKSVFRVPAMPLNRFAGWVKKKMRLRHVLVSGAAGKTIRTAWLAMGDSGDRPVLEAVKQGIDCVVAGETCEWQAVRFAEDAGLPLIVVGHCTSENEGMRRMADFLRERLPGPEYLFLDAGHPLRPI